MAVLDTLIDLDYDRMRYERGDYETARFRQQLMDNANNAANPPRMVDGSRVPMLTPVSKPRSKALLLLKA